MNRNNPTIELSFIIPVYNVEQYLSECLDSILRQFTPECEMILVDDGSTDTSGAICDAYREHAERIRVVHQENAGAATARNTGLAHASGRYVAFVDSDDRIAQGSLASLLDWIKRNRADICFLDAVKFYPDGKSEPLGDNIAGEELRNRSRLEVCRYLASRDKFPGSACTKLFRRDFLMEKGLMFPVVKRQAEDLFFVRDCIMQAETFDALQIPYYQYRQGRKGSSTETLAQETFWDLLHFVESSAALMTRDREPLDACCGHLMNYVSYEYSILLWCYSRFPREVRRVMRGPLKDQAWVMRYSGIPKTKLTGAMMKLVGLENTARLLKLYIRLRG